MIEPPTLSVFIAHLKISSGYSTTQYAARVCVNIYLDMLHIYYLPYQLGISHTPVRFVSVPTLYGVFRWVPDLKKLG